MKNVNKRMTGWTLYTKYHWGAIQPVIRLWDSGREEEDIRTNSAKILSSRWKALSVDKLGIWKDQTKKMNTSVERPDFTKVEVQVPTEITLPEFDEEFEKLKASALEFGFSEELAVKHAIEKVGELKLESYNKMKSDVEVKTGISELVNKVISTQKAFEEAKEGLKQARESSEKYQAVVKLNPKPKVSVAKKWAIQSSIEGLSKGATIVYRPT